MVLGNGSDAESLEFTFNYNPPVDAAAAERVLKEVKEILPIWNRFSALFGHLSRGDSRWRHYRVG